MTTRMLDIEANFVDGVNIGTFLRSYVSRLVSTAGMTRRDAMAYTAGTGVRQGTKRGRGMLFIAGTLHVGTGEDDIVTPLQQEAIDEAVLEQDGREIDGTYLVDLDGISEKSPGDQIFVTDAPRAGGGVGCIVYWDGGSWRRISDDAAV